VRVDLRSGWWPLAVALAITLSLTACGAAKRDPLSAGRPVQGYHPERFPDIPLPPGYALDPERDQLAVVIAEGLVRRYEVFLVQRSDAQSRAGTDLLAWYDRVLSDTGWTPFAADDRSRTFRKQRSASVGEQLTVRAYGRMASFHLRPWSPGS